MNKKMFGVLAAMALTVSALPMSAEACNITGPGFIHLPEFDVVDPGFAHVPVMGPGIRLPEFDIVDPGFVRLPDFDVVDPGFIRLQLPEMDEETKDQLVKVIVDQLMADGRLPLEEETAEKLVRALLDAVMDPEFDPEDLKFDIVDLGFIRLTEDEKEKLYESIGEVYEFIVEKLTENQVVDPGFARLPSIDEEVIGGIYESIVDQLTDHKVVDPGFARLPKIDVEKAGKIYENVVDKLTEHKVVDPGFARLPWF